MGSWNAIVGGCDIDGIYNSVAWIRLLKFTPANLLQISCKFWDCQTGQKLDVNYLANLLQYANFSYIGSRSVILNGGRSLQQVYI